MTRKLAPITVFLFALAMSIGAFAGTKSESVTLYSDAQLNGKTLPAGDYTVKYEMTGSNAQVKFMRNGKEVATANGQVKQLGARPDATQVITDSNGNTASISEIDFAHSTTGITFGSGAMASAGGQ